MVITNSLPLFSLSLSLFIIFAITFHINSIKEQNTEIWSKQKTQAT